MTRGKSAAVFATIMVATTAGADTIDVPADYARIQDAIAAASDGDTVLIQPGTYGDLLDFLGKAITVTGTAPTDPTVVEATVVDGGSKGSVVTFASGEPATAVLAGLTLTGGSGTTIAIGPFGGESTAGGGVYVAGSAATVEKCRIVGNRVAGEDGTGAGIYVADGQAALQDCDILQNEVEDVHSFHGDGGGVAFLRSTGQVIGCRIAENWAHWSGGGVWITEGAAVDVAGCMIVDNVSGDGGGIACKDASVRITDCVLSGNDAVDGGGVNAWGAPESRLRIERSSVTDNTATDGGGIYIRAFRDGAPATIVATLIMGNAVETLSGGGVFSLWSDPVFHNCEILNNTASGSGSGGGVYTRSGTPLFSNCIIAGNSARDGGAIETYVSTREPATHPRFLNCTVTGNSARRHGGAVYTWSGRQPDGCIPEFVNTVFWNNGASPIYNRPDAPGELTVTYCDVEGGYSGPGNIDANPLLVSAAGFDYLLAPGSPCIDSGDPAIEDGISDWHPAWPAWYPNGARSDMGAYGGTGNRAWLNR